MPRSVINATVAVSLSSSTGGSGSVSTGDVVSSGISVDNAIARWDGATGKLIQTSGISLTDTADINNVRSIDMVPTASNPGGVSTLWIDSGTGKLFRGAVDVEASAGGGSNPIALGYFENFSSPYSIAVSTTPALLNPTMVFSSTGGEFGNSGGTFTYLGADTVPVRCTVDLSYIAPASGIHIGTFTIYTNGSALAGGSRRLFINSPSICSINTIIPSCTTGTTIQVYVNITTTATFNIGCISVCLEALH